MFYKKVVYNIYIKCKSELRRPPSYANITHIKTPINDTHTHNYLSHTHTNTRVFSSHPDTPSFTSHFMYKLQKKRK